MNKEIKYINEICEGFQRSKGRAYCYAKNPVNYAKLITIIIALFKKKRDNDKILIIADEYDKLVRIKDNLSDNGLKDFTTLSFITTSFFNENYRYNYSFTILLDVVNAGIINYFTNNCKFILSVNTNHVNDIRIFNGLNAITTTISEMDLKEDNFKSPVEETHISIDVDTDTRNTYNEYDKYIADSITIIGSVELIEQCRVGNSQNNMSAIDVRYSVAKANGWSETLDCTQEFNRRLDEIFNPNSIADRANNFYNITRERRNIVLNYNKKLDTILDIVNKNKDKKILIVSKTGEFASEIANYINTNSDIICGEYHNEIPSAYINDSNGNVICYKSGEKKGEPKVFAAKSISSLNLQSFNNGYTKVLSIKNSSDKDLKCAVDLVILTTPLIDDITDIKKRFVNVSFSTPTFVYVIFCSNTIEEKRLSEKIIPSYVNVTEQEIDVKFDDNGNIIL